MLYFSIVLVPVLVFAIVKIIGLHREECVKSFLNHLDTKKYKILHNVSIPSQDKDCTIHHVVVSCYGIFVILNNNHKGWILGDEKSKFWTQIIYERKEAFYNPILQVNTQIEALKNVLKEYSGVPFYPVITFTTKVNLKVSSKTHVIYRINLLNVIQRYKKEMIESESVNKIVKLLSSVA